MKYSLATLALFASATSMMWADTLTDSETSSATTDFAKQYNPIHTEAISLGVTPDARGGAMGDVGAATEPDENSQYWNPAKYAFAYSRGGIAVNYTPWLRRLLRQSGSLGLPPLFLVGRGHRHRLQDTKRGRCYQPDGDDARPRL